MSIFPFLRSQDGYQDAIPVQDGRSKTEPRPDNLPAVESTNIGLSPVGNQTRGMAACDSESFTFDHSGKYTSYEVFVKTRKGVNKRPFKINVIYLFIAFLLPTLTTNN